MQDLLTPVTARTVPKAGSYADLVPVGSSSTTRETIIVQSPHEALQALRSQPTVEQLSEVLHQLASGNHVDGDFHVKAPSPKASQIIFALINDVIPNYWKVLDDTKDPSQLSLRKDLIRCLSSIAGIGAIASQLQVLLKELSSQSKPEKSGNIQQIEDIVNVLERILKDDAFASNAWNDLNIRISSQPKKTLVWKELISLLATGRLLSLAAEADHFINQSSSSIRKPSWLSDGSKYAMWLGRNCACMMNRLRRDDQDEQKAIVQLLSKSLTVGYTGAWVRLERNEL